MTSPSRFSSMGSVARAVGLLMLVAMPAEAARPAGIALGAQSLAGALRAMALSSGRTILFTPDLVAGRSIPAMTLEGTPLQMIQKLISGSGLEVRAAGPAAFVIIRSPKLKPAPARPLPPLASLDPGDILVTALRRPVRLADVPLSMVAVTGVELERRQAVDLSDVAAIAPSLAVTDMGSGLSRLSLRGAYTAGESTVGLYYGDIPVAGPSGSTSDPGLMTPDLLLVDVDRVEVLRGPQGTLYGAGSLAGTVRILFRQPDMTRTEATMQLRGALTAGGGPDANASVTANLPVVRDDLAIRAVAYRDRQGGVIDDVSHSRADVDGLTRTGGRLAIRWRIDPAWRIDLTAAVQQDRDADAANGQIGYGAYQTAQAVRTPFTDTFWMASAALHGDLGRGISLDATLARSRWTPHRMFDFTRVETAERSDPSACARYSGGNSCSVAQMASFAAYVDSQTPSLLDQPLSVAVNSAEARLSGEGRLTWTAGLFASDRRDAGRSTALPVDASTGVVAADVVPTGDRSFGGRLEQFAVFADATWTLSPLISLSAGGRYFRYRRSAEGTVEIINPITGPANTPPFTGSYRASGGVGRVRAELRPAAGVLAYAQVSSGFRPGGINVVPGLDPTLAVYRDDRLASYEAGTRLSFDRDRLRLEAAIYRQDWAHMQYSAFSDVGGYVFITNIGSARIDGVELGLSWVPNRIVQARIDATYTDARLTSDQTNAAANAAGRRGDRLPYVAPVAVSASIALDQPVGEQLHLIADAAITYVSRSSSTFQSDDPDHLAIGDFELVDVSAGIARGVNRASLFVRNLADANKRTWATSNVFGTGEIRQNRPRTIGVSLTRSF